MSTFLVGSFLVGLTACSKPEGAFSSPSPSNSPDVRGMFLVETERSNGSPPKDWPEQVEVFPASIILGIEKDSIYGPVWSILFDFDKDGNDFSKFYDFYLDAGFDFDKVVSLDPGYSVLGRGHGFLVSLSTDADNYGEIVVRCLSDSEDSTGRVSMCQ